MKKHLSLHRGLRPFPLLVVFSALALIGPIVKAQCSNTLADSYAAFALANELAKTNSTGEVQYEAGYGPVDDKDGDGLNNREEWQGYLSTTNGGSVYYGWRATLPVGAPAGTVILPGSCLEQVDSDQDGLSDFFESLQSNGPGTNPRRADTDGDGMGDAWEVRVGLNPRDNGTLNPDNAATADPDGDGLTNLEEMRNFIPSPATIENPINVPGFGTGHPYTLPLNYDSDGDRLIDSFELGQQHGLDPTQVQEEGNNADSDPDRDGLTTYREQCVHPLMTRCWPSGLPNVLPSILDSFNGYGGYGRNMLFASGYLNLAKWNKDGDSATNTGVVGRVLVQWDHPVNDPGYGGTRRWSNPGDWDTDGDLLPDGWELEHGLNLITSASFFENGVFNISGTLGDPDQDGLYNYEEYFGADGYRIDYITGTGDETVPWLARVLNNDHVTDYFRRLLLTNCSGSGVANSIGGASDQAPATYGSDFYAKYTPTNYPGFFDPIRFAAGINYPVPGVPPFVTRNYSPSFNPFATAVSGIVFQDLNMDGKYSTGEPVWLNTNMPNTITFEAGEPVLVGSPAVASSGFTILSNHPVVYPVFGRDTDNDGLSDFEEIYRTLIDPTMRESSPVQSFSPYSNRSAKIMNASGLTQVYTDATLVGRRFFNRSFTIEAWVYLASNTPNPSYRGAFIRGEANVANRNPLTYELGIDAKPDGNQNIPYFSFQPLNGLVTYKIFAPVTNYLSKWVHLAGVFDQKQNRMSLYIDGNLKTNAFVGSESASSFALCYGGNLFMGRDLGGPTPFVNNLWIDEVRIWGIPLSDLRIQANKNTLINPVQVVNASDYLQWEDDVVNGLFAYYTFDNGVYADDLTKRVKSSLTGYNYPHDAAVRNFPDQEYLYNDSAFFILTNNLFEFDSGNVPPVNPQINGSRPAAFDSDGDGLPDDWEIINELNPFRIRTPDHRQFSNYDAAWATNGEPAWYTGAEFPNNDGDRDIDDDGLINRIEFELGSNPRDGELDKFIDLDGDGLSNLEEGHFGTNPLKPDTDDDGINDITELEIGTNPVNDLSPFVLRHLKNDGTGYLTVPGTVPGYDEYGKRFNLNEWTLEAMVRVTEPPTQNIILVQRKVQPNGRRTFELGINSDLRPYVLFDNVNINGGKTYAVTGNVPVQLNSWTMISGRYGKSSDPGVTNFQLALFVDGVRLIRDTVNALPAVGRQDDDVIIGKNLKGDLDEVRIWNRAAADSFISELYYKTMLFGRDAALLGGLKPQGEGMQASNDRYTILAPFTLQAWFRTTDDGVIVQRVGGSSEHDGSPLYNYQFAVENNTVVARITGLYRYGLDGRWATHVLTGAQEINDDNWHHAALIFDGTVARYLVDSVEVNSRNIFEPSPSSMIWHLRPEEQEPEFTSLINLVDRTAIRGVEIGPQIDNGYVDEVSLKDGAMAISNIVANYKQKVVVDNSVRMYFDFDFHDSGKKDVVDAANLNNPGKLIGDGAVVREANGNAPLESDNRDIITLVMAAYFSMNDGTSTDRQQVQDAVGPRAWQNYTDASATIAGSNNAIIFMNIVPANANFNVYAPPGRYPQFFPLPTDSPWRLDSDRDGMPDVFEQYFGTDPNQSASIADPEFDPFGDMDSDRLPNIYEYWAGTDPTFWDSNLNTVSDSDEDADGDGLSNYAEYLKGTHPGRKDTDDDGIEDGAELDPLQFGGISNPWDSMDPKSLNTNYSDVRRFKSLKLESGANRFMVPSPPQGRFRFISPAWTLECWFKPDGSAQNGSLIEYVGTYLNASSPPTIATNVFFRLGVANNIPYVELQTASPDARPRINMTPLINMQWTHLAASFDPADATLRVFRDGVGFAALEVHGFPLSGSDTTARLPGRVYIGDNGLTGYLDDVRIWNVARTHEQVIAGQEAIVQLNEPGMVANFRFDDGRQGGLLDSNADGSLANDGRGAEDFANRSTANDLETAWAYSLKKVRFDAVHVPPSDGVGYDDQDRDAIYDAWENIYFSPVISYYETQRDSVGNIIASSPSVTRLLANEDYGNTLVNLGWSVDYSSLESVYQRRLWDAPDAAYYLKSVALNSAPTNVELRIAFNETTIPGNRRLWLNGAEIDLTNPAYPSAPTTFATPDNLIIKSIYIGSPYLDGLLTNGHNRIAFYLVNDNGTGADLYEFFDLQLMVDGKIVVRKGGDTSGVALDSRWWVYGASGSMALPPPDGAGRLWFETQYGYDGDQDTDSDSLFNIFEQYIRTNPLDKDTDKDGVLDIDEDPDGDGLSNIQEQSKQTQPMLPDTDDDGFADGFEVQKQVLPSDALDPSRNMALRLDGSAGTLLQAPSQMRFGLQSFTLGARYKLNAMTSGASLISRAVANNTFNYRLGWFSDGSGVARPSIEFHSTDGILTRLWASNTVPTNTWSHMAATFSDDTGTLRLYLDGQLRREIVTEKRPRASGIGPIQTLIGSLFNGLIDEVVLVDHALSASSVGALSSTSDARDVITNGLVAYYRFDDETNPVGVSGLPGAKFGQIQDFAGKYDDDWQVQWRHSATLRGNASLTLYRPDRGVLYVTSPNPNGVYPQGSTVTVWVVFSEPVSQVLGSPVVDLEVNITNRFAAYISGANPNTNTLAFRYIVQTADWSWDLDYVNTNSLLQAGGAIIDSKGEFFNLSLPAPGAFGSLGWNKDLIIGPAFLATDPYGDWSMLYFGVPYVDPSLDPDGDGVSNFMEFLAGTNPTDPSSVFAMAQVNGQGTSIRVVWSAVTGRMYRIERTTALPNSSWTLYQMITATNPIMSVIVPIGSNEYYRATTTPTP